MTTKYLAIVAIVFVFTVVALTQALPGNRTHVMESSTNRTLRASGSPLRNGSTKLNTTSAPPKTTNVRPVSSRTLKNETNVTERSSSGKPVVPVVGRNTTAVHTTHVLDKSEVRTGREARHLLKKLLKHLG